MVAGAQREGLPILEETRGTESLCLRGPGRCHRAEDLYAKPERKSGVLIRGEDKGRVPGGGVSTSSGFQA